MENAHKTLQPYVCVSVFPPVVAEDAVDYIMMTISKGLQVIFMH